jgi:hypothetical protein
VDFLQRREFKLEYSKERQHLGLLHVDWMTKRKLILNTIRRRWFNYSGSDSVPVTCSVTCVEVQTAAVESAIDLNSGLRWGKPTLFACDQ